MACDQTQLLSPYLDGELPPAEADRVRAHVAACPACAAELDGLRAVSRLMSVARTSYPADADEVMARLRLHVADLVESADTGLIRLARVFTAVAASVLVGGLWLLSQPPSNPTNGVQAKAVPWDHVEYVLTSGGDEQPAATTEPTTREAILDALYGVREAAVVAAPGGAEGDLP